MPKRRTKSRTRRRRTPSRRPLRQRRSSRSRVRVNRIKKEFKPLVDARNKIENDERLKPIVAMSDKAEKEIKQDIKKLTPQQRLEVGKESIKAIETMVKQKPGSQSQVNQIEKKFEEKTKQTQESSAMKTMKKVFGTIIMVAWEIIKFLWSIGVFIVKVIFQIVVSVLTYVLIPLIPIIVLLVGIGFLLNSNIFTNAAEQVQGQIPAAIPVVRALKK